MKRCSETSTCKEQPERKCSKTLELLQWDYLWKQAPVFPVGAKWADPRLLSNHNWKFSKLEDAFKEGGLLHGKENVFLFTHAEPLRVYLDGQTTSLHGPVVIVIVSPFSPSDKMAIVPVQGGGGVASPIIVDMGEVNMAWLPCTFPLGQGGDTPLPQISVISYAQNVTTLDGIALGPNSHLCFPYFDNLSKAKQSTVIDVVYPAEGEPIVVDRFNWKFELRGMFIGRLINEGKLSIDHKDAFKAFLKEKVKQAKISNKKAIQALEELRTDAKVAAFENMRFYKFYPDFTAMKTSSINYYYGKAHQIF